MDACLQGSESGKQTSRDEREKINIVSRENVMSQRQSEFLLVAIWVGLHLAILALEEGDNHLRSHLYICISFSPPSAAGRDALAASPHLLLQQISHQIQPGGTTNREREESARATHLFLLMMLISSNIKMN